MTASPPKIDINKLRQMISYDPETGFLKWIVPRRGHSAGSPAGYSHRTGYTFLEIENRHYAGHRVAWAVVHGKWPRYIDHINGNRSDNRLANLREATWQQNQANRPTFKNNHAGIKGVRFDHRHGKWQARIRQKHLGYFETAEEASAAYGRAAVLAYGDFARPI